MRRNFFTSSVVRSRDQRVELCRGLTISSMNALILSDPSRLNQLMAPACTFWCQHGFSKARTKEEGGAPKNALTFSRKCRHLPENVLDFERALNVGTPFLIASTKGGLGMISISIKASRNLVSKLLHPSSNILVAHLTMEPSGWLHIAALEG